MCQQHSPHALYRFPPFIPTRSRQVHEPATRRQGINSNSPKIIQRVSYSGELRSQGWYPITLSPQLCCGVHRPVGETNGSNMIRVHGLWGLHCMSSMLLRKHENERTRSIEDQGLEQSLKGMSSSSWGWKTKNPSRKEVNKVLPQQRASPTQRNKSTKGNCVTVSLCTADSLTWAALRWAALYSFMERRMSFRAS